MSRLLFAVGLLLALNLGAQSPTVSLSVLVLDSTRAPVPEALVQVTPVGADARAVSGRSDASGQLQLTGLRAGDADLIVARLGFATYRARLTLRADTPNSTTVVLSAQAQRLGTITIVSLPPDLVPTQSADRGRIAASAPHDASTVLRELPGTDAMRRGALGLDPVVRGLRDAQLGIYVDAARTFPGGPAGMDTPMSHVDPAHVERIEVISGPYALTWGAGNLSAIRVSTLSLPAPGAAPLRSRFGTGYDGNLQASEFTGLFSGALGRSGSVRYATSAAYREGGDYVDGAGRPVAGDFRSYEGRTRVGVGVGRHGLLSVLGSFQAQRDVDYPGRPLDAKYFDTYQLQAEYGWARPTGAGRLRSVDVLAYVYDVDHLMNNDHKPTARPDPTRTPPFPTDIQTQSGVRVIGGRVAATVAAPAGWTLELGGDVYEADHDASRTVDRRDTGVRLRSDLIWGGAWIRDAGLFARAERDIGRSRLGVAARVDQVWADADSVSAFFAGQYGTDASSTETNWSAAATWRVPLSPRWTTTLGLGSVVRTAEANERFSDRAASKRAQTNAEFLGDPTLAPERSTQADLWLEGRLGRTALQVNAFARRLDDYITIEGTALPTAQPASPPPVFRYINGTAEYVGGEAVLTSALTSALTLGGSVSVLSGRDITLREPALGVTPLRASALARWAPAAAWFTEAQVTVADAQTRVATTRGERPTPGWTTVDVQAGYEFRAPLLQGVSVRAGARNVLDRAYVHHLSANNAFGGGRLYEPGRVWFVRVSVGE